MGLRSPSPHSSPAITGHPQTVNTVLILTAPATFVVGLVLAWWLRRTRPQVYADFAAESAE